mgnify:CR=1 FL=1
MVNNAMNNSSENRTQTEQEEKPSSVPNEAGSFAVEGHVKIFDPETREVFVEKRA